MLSFFKICCGFICYGFRVIKPRNIKPITRNNPTRNPQHLPFWFNLCKAIIIILNLLNHIAHETIIFCRLYLPVFHNSL